MKEKVFYVGLQKGDKELGIPDLHLVEGESCSSKVFDEEKETIVGLTETAKRRGITIPKKLLVPFIALLMLMGSASFAYGDATDCFYPWHDHYKTNYRKRHKHKVCGSVGSIIDWTSHYERCSCITPEYILGKCLRMKTIR